MGVSLVDRPVPSALDLAVGSSIRFILCYLPMLLYCSIVASVLRTRTSRATVLVGGVCVRIMSAGILHGLSFPSYSSTAKGFVFSMPYFLAIFILGQMWGTGDLAGLHMGRPWKVYVAGLVSWIAVGILQIESLPSPTMLAGVGGQMVASVVACTALYTALQLRTLRVRRCTVASTALGVYLIHMIPLNHLEQSGLLSDVSWIPWTLVAGMLTLAISSVAAMGLARVPVLRRTVV